jgi:hypothetical protein
LAVISFKQLRGFYFEEIPYCHLLPARSETPAQSAYDGGWLVELVDGTLCRPATGASFEVKGKAATYCCDNWQKGKDIVLLGGLNTASPLWTAEKATIVQGPRGPNYLSSHKVAVKTVWQ